ncbi:hypothetical protein SAMN05444358_10239 [Ruegeria halocynthiae]|uniref:Bile acid:Na+ symporter, BASS family n=1 Tax=Ruegeria halocynthiae TaxID=985054 RepID=A0A1H2XRT9_9RHOB|nr:hypothetical protein [Ruegeria halocynthiae]SDW95632.1 hypothetical protein SAMN05444358_10239 [Ruegeria halocynthiae]
MNPLHLAARHGPYVLVSGLAAGLLLPGLAEPMRPLLPPLVMVLLFLTLLRMKPGAILGSLADLRQVAGTIVAFQLAMPLMVAVLGFVGGWTGTPVFLSLLIMASAPSISGSPNMCLMMGHPAEHAMRLVVVGTAALPLTALPIFWLMPELGDIQAVLKITLRLFFTIVIAILAAVVLRRTVLRTPSKSTLLNLEGAATITLAVFVVGLMPSVSATALVDPSVALFWIVFACLINFGAQAVSFQLTQARLPAAEATAVSLIAGNRNIAIFFVALPPEVTAPTMVFIGAYQIPMYLTPLVMRRLYQRTTSAR